MASTTFIIRDALETDLAACLAIDHRYETEYVWQMQIVQPTGQWQITFKTERLPRTLETEYPASEHRLRLTLPPDQCFLVAGQRDQTEILGYLSMRHEPARRVGWIQDIVVDHDYRRVGIGSRMLRVARQWALEHGLTRLMVETQTRNYPAISFCTSTGFVFCGYNDRYLDNQDIALFFGQTLR